MIFSAALEASVSVHSFQMPQTSTVIYVKEHCLKIALYWVYLKVQVLVNRPNLDVEIFVKYQDYHNSSGAKLTANL